MLLEMSGPSRKAILLGCHLNWVLNDGQESTCCIQEQGPARAKALKQRGVWHVSGPTRLILTSSREGTMGLARGQRRSSDFMPRSVRRLWRALNIRVTWSDVDFLEANSESQCSSQRLCDPVFPFWSGNSLRTKILPHSPLDLQSLD